VLNFNFQFFKFSNSMKKLIQLSIVVIAMFTLSGCLGGLMGMVCDFLPDADHCNQAAAIQEADPYGCDKIEGKGFSGSNPPRDKCYLLIAENTGDYGACDRIKGGNMSYTREECITGAAVKNEDPEGCRLLSGNAFQLCKEKTGVSITTDKLKDINDEVEQAKSAAGHNPDDPEAKKMLADLQKKQKALFEFAPDSVQKEFFKQGREAIMEDIEDEDVKSEISKLFVDMRNKNPNMDVNTQLGKIQEIKDQQELVKNLDEQANTLMDQIKSQANDVASGTLEDIYGEDVEKIKAKMAEKGMKYVEDKVGTANFKYGVERLEKMKAGYDKASEQYEKISEQVEKLKKVYGEAKEIYTKIDEVSKLLGEGKIDKGKAKVLQGAILLGKGLEYTTDYVPVFGSTISTITKETFNATVIFATKRAQRTTSLDKCIDDPLNCDTEGISGY